MTPEDRRPSGLRLVLVRHGESEANVGDFINDDPNRPVALTPRGIAQAQAAAKALAGQTFSLAYASEFPRAQQTARLLLAGSPCALQIDARLNERCSGMDGQPTATFNDWVRPDPVRRKPPLGESFLEQMDRLRGFLNYLRETGAVGTVLAVSHENPILAVRALAGMPPEQAARQHLANCAWIRVAWQAGQWREED